MRGTEIANILRRHRFSYGTELELQNGIAAVLTRASLLAEAEFRLNSFDRIDFLVGAVGIEVKTGGPFSAVLRQLYRYAASDRIGELILVTTRHSHSQVPVEILGKAVAVVYVGGLR